VCGRMGRGCAGGRGRWKGGGEKSSLGWAIKGSRPCCETRNSEDGVGYEGRGRVATAMWSRAGGGETQGEGVSQLRGRMVVVWERTRARGGSLVERRRGLGIGNGAIECWATLDERKCCGEEGRVREEKGVERDRRAITGN
jgi:hypothetical protein